MPSLVTMRMLEWDGSFLGVVDNVFSTERCVSLINSLSPNMWTPAKLDDKDASVDLTIRNHGRQIIRDELLATELFDLLKEWLPKKQVDSSGRVWNLREVNPMMRYLRYKPEEFFAPHYDGPTVLAGSTIQSFITLQLYLTDNPYDGATCFLPDELAPDLSPLRIFPRSGSILLFEHDLLHQGETIKEGEKVTVRTDILYELTNSQDSNVSKQ